MVKQSMYEELMNKHNIVSIMSGNDLAVDPVTGSLMMSERGGLMWQGKVHNAMFQLVRDFEMKAPNLHKQFAEIVDSDTKEAVLVDVSNKHSEEMARKMMNNELVDGAEMHALSDVRGVTQTGREVCAASIFIALNTMLQALKNELGVNQQKFLQSGPLYSGQSFGNVVWAASNNARHAGEWRVRWVADKCFTDQQLKSVRVLAPVLGYEGEDYRHLAGEICAPVLAIISSGDFDILERGLFAFANNLAAGCEDSKALARP